MKIGVFDSGLGGLWVLKHIRDLLPQYDYVFMGDQKNVPYGSKTVPELLQLTKKALAFLYEKEDCKAVLLACNTVSSTIYDELKEWVNDTYPGCLVFGIVEPTVQALSKSGGMALFGTTRTIESGLYQNRLSFCGHAHGIALPELTTIIEKGGPAGEYISKYADKINSAVHYGALVCTHYGIVLDEFRKTFPHIEHWYAQENIIPQYLREYLHDNPDKVPGLSQNGTVRIFVTAENSVFDNFLKEWFPGSSSQQVDI